MDERLYNLEYGSMVGSETGYTGFRNRLRQKRFLAIINPHTEDRILEIGCNNGELTSLLSGRVKEAYGTDINHEMINKLNDPKILFMPATDMKFENDYFDTVCSFEVFEHILEIEKAFAEVLRVLKPAGRFIFSYPLELVRGQSAVSDAIKIYGDPLRARELHVHKLTPKKILKIIAGLPLRMLRWQIHFLPLPLYVTIMEKQNWPEPRSLYREPAIRGMNQIYRP